MENAIGQISNQNVLKVALESEKDKTDFLMSYSEAYGGERA
jgi:hypothetical protein